MGSSKRVLVYGAYGHTGRFVVDELLRREIVPVLAGRSAAKVESLAGSYPGLERRTIAIDGSAELREAMEGTAAVINCAGPFLDTAIPVAGAAIAVGAHYLDVSAEQASVQVLYEKLHAAATNAGVALVPAMSFFGGLADLLVTAALDGSECVDDVTVAIALDRWWPTPGTRSTGRRNTATRVVIRDGQLVALGDPAPTRTWAFPRPFNDQAVVELPFSEVVTIARHLKVRNLRSYLNLAPLNDLHDATTPPPSPADETGRSAQRFIIDVALRCGSQTSRISASGRDIYAVTAPIIVEGVIQLLSGRSHHIGATAPGEAFNARNVLTALSSDSLELSH